MTSRNYFHLHLVSDATGETLIAISRAAAAQFQDVSSIEHIYPLIRAKDQLDKVIQEISSAPGIVLYTLVAKDLSEHLQQACMRVGFPCLSVLEPILGLFQSYLGAVSTPKPGAQHMLNSDYFRRIDALNFTMMHDDGQLPEDLDTADVILLGVSRTSKTPTSIYLANRGIKTINIPLVPDMALPEQLFRLKKALVVGLIASADRIIQIRQKRLLSLNANYDSAYVEKASVVKEILDSRKLFEKHHWNMIDVTRRSIEETAAEIIKIHNDHKAQKEKLLTR